MAQVKMISTFEDMKGKINGVVIFHRNGKTFVRRYVKPRKRLEYELSQAEKNARENFRKASEMLKIIKADEERIKKWKELFDLWNKRAEIEYNYYGENENNMKKYSTLEGFIMARCIEGYKNLENINKN